MRAHASERAIRASNGFREKTTSARTFKPLTLHDIKYDLLSMVSPYYVAKASGGRDAQINTEKRTDEAAATGEEQQHTTR